MPPPVSLVPVWESSVRPHRAPAVSRWAALSPVGDAGRPLPGSAREEAEWARTPSSKPGGPAARSGLLEPARPSGLGRDLLSQEGRTQLPGSQSSELGCLCLKPGPPHAPVVGELGAVLSAFFLIFLASPFDLKLQ